jgi:hypothetical protein
MAIGPIELNGALQRVQDIATIKQNQDNKAIVNQSAFQDTFSKEIEAHSTRVTDPDETDKEQRKFDAKDKGDNEYSGDGGKNQKQNARKKTDRMVIKGQSGSFDIKI